jgi:hypothetical protein
MSDIKIQRKQQALHGPQEGARIPILPGNLKNPFDGSRVVAEPPIYRYYWRLIWTDGSVRFQYESFGGKIIQTLFGKLPTLNGVKELWVSDVFKTPDDTLLRIQIPEGHVPDIFYPCCSTMDGAAQPHRIYSFGYKNENKCFYAHLLPGFDPPRILKTNRRSISWSEVPKPQGASY